MAFLTDIDFSKLSQLQESAEKPDRMEISLESGADVVNLPSNDFTQFAEVFRDGVDLILEAPDGSVVVINGYFNAENPPLLLAPDGTALTPSLVNSFAHHIGSVQTAQQDTMNDASPIGGIQEFNGDVTITRVDGSVINAKVGLPIYQGDMIETKGDGAANIVFVDETSFAISEEASLVIDEYVFDPSNNDGTTNFSMLRGVFMFTSGLIGHENPSNVDIETPMGSIGIRGTVIAGDVTGGNVTIVEGAMFIQDRSGNRVDLDQIFETAKFQPATGTLSNAGFTTAADLGAKFSAINNVAPTLFNVISKSAPSAGQDGIAVQQQARAAEAAENNNNSNGERGAQGNAAQGGEGGSAGAQQGAAQQQGEGATQGDGGIQGFGETGSGFEGPNGAADGQAPNPNGTGGAAGTLGVAPPPPAGTAGPAGGQPPAGANPPPAGATQPLPPPPNVINGNVTPDLLLNSSIVATQGFRLAGTNGFGTSLSLYRDVNGDNIADIAVLNNDAASGFTIINSVTRNLGANYVTPQGAEAQGNGIAGIGDFDGDGVQDVVIGLPSFSEAGNTGSGQITVISGTASTSMSGGDQILFQDIDPGTGLGEVVSGIGDFNGDGYSDFIIGVPNMGHGGLTNNGVGIILFGGRTGFGDIPSSKFLDFPIETNSFGASAFDSVTPLDNGHGIVLAIGAGAVRIVDFDTNGAPVDVSGNFDDTNLPTPLSAVTANGFAYVLDQGGQIVTFDIHDPANVTDIDQQAVGTLTTASRIFYDDAENKLFVTTDTGSTAGVEVYDLTNPAMPSLIDTGYTLPALAGFTSAQINGNLAFFVSGTVLSVVDLNLTTPSSSAAIGAGLTDAEFAGVSQIEISADGTKAYMLNDTTGKIFIIDISTPATMSIIGTAITTVPNATHFSLVEEAGTALLYVTSVDAGDDKLSLLDVSNPASPQSVFSFGSPSLEGANHIQFVDGILYVSKPDGIVELDTVETLGRYIYGGANGDNLGQELSSAGDFNNDGFGDFVITSPGSNSVHVVFGNEDGTINNATDALTLSNVSISASDQVIPVFYAGDMNRDGISDIMVVETGAGSGFGRVNLLFGDNGASRNANNDSTLINATNTRVALSNSYINGMVLGQDGIIGASSAGDFDGDGFDDAVVAVRKGNAVDFFIFDMNAFPPGGTAAGLTLNPNVDNGEIFHIHYQLPTAAAVAEFEFQAADLNGDGFSDLVIGNAAANGGAGEVFVINGRNHGGGVIIGNNLMATGNDQALVGTTGIDDINGGSFTKLSVHTGAGGDVLRLTGVEQNYSFTNIASDSTNGAGAQSVWANNQDNIFVVNSTDLQVYSFDGIAGNLVFKDAFDISGGGTIVDLFGDGNTVFAAATDRIEAYRFDGTSIIQLESDNAIVTDADSVWADDGYIFVTNSSVNGIKALTFDGATFSVAGTAYAGESIDIFGNQNTNYIISTDGTSVEFLSFDGTNFSQIDSVAHVASNVWADNSYYYSANGNTIRAYSFGGSTATFLGSFTLPVGDGTISSISGNDQYIYVGTEGGTNHGVHTLRFDGSSFSSVGYEQTTGDATDVMATEGQVFVAAGSDGIELYRSENLFNDNTMLKIDLGDGNDLVQLTASANGRALDFSHVGSEALSGVENFVMSGSDQIIRIGLDDIFRLLQESDNSGELKFSANGNSSNQLIIDDGEQTDRNQTLEDLGFSFVGAIPDGADTFYEYSFGSGYTVKIQDVIVENGNLHIA